MNALNLKNFYYHHNIKDVVIKILCTGFCVRITRITFIQNVTEVHVN